jgi:predicted peptidase
MKERPVRAVEGGFNISALFVLILSISLTPGRVGSLVGQSAQTLTLQDRGVDHINYLLYLPAGYTRDVVSRWPLILFLHGSEERGDNPGLVKEYGIPAMLDNRRDFPFIVVSPQCPPDKRWSPEWIKKILAEVEAGFRVDENRVYLTGFSMGGYGTWDTAVAYPELFAAIAPVSGGGDELKASRLKDMPIWAFHGAKDVNVPVKESVSMVQAVKPYGGEVKLTIYPQLAHDVWTVTYQNEELYEWFLAHAKVQTAPTYQTADTKQKAVTPSKPAKPTVVTTAPKTRTRPGSRL